MKFYFIILLASLNIYGARIFLAAKPHNSLNARNCIELHSFSTSNHRNPFFVTKASIREETSSLTVSFAVSICRIVVLLSFSSRRNHFVALAIYLWFAYCCQHRTNLRTLDHFRFIVFFSVFLTIPLHWHRFRVGSLCRLGIFISSVNDN